MRATMRVASERGATGVAGGRSIRVLMAGPLPPAIGGMTSVIHDLAESKLREHVAIVLFDTAKVTPLGRSLWQAILVRLALWRRWWSALGGQSRLVAHIHTCSGLSFFLDGALALIARAHGVPVVLHIHGGRFDTFLAELDPARRLLARVIAQSAACVIVLSESWRTRLAALLPGVRWEVVENGVPMPPAGEQAAGEGEPVVVFVGAVCRAKGVEELVRAAAQLRSHARIVIVGPETESGFVGAMQLLAAEFRDDHPIDFVGPRVGAEKWAWLRRAQVFVLPSHAEAQPISILEAMSVGCPVIATAVGAVPTMILDGESGLLVAPRDVSGLAKALDLLIPDSALQRQLATRARRECEERFSIDRTAHRLEGIYTDVA